MRVPRALASNPFLTLGLAGVLVFAAWVLLGLDPRDGGVGQGLFLLWRALAAPVHVAANLLAPATDQWPDALDAGAALVAGLVPYVLADAIWRRWRARARDARSHATRGGDSFAA